MIQRAEFDTVAAVDLGSNSFHMIVAQLDHDQLRIIDRLRERVALAEGLDAQSRLDPRAQERAFECLKRFGQRLAHMPRGAVRAVGTNTLRRARDARSFLLRARDILGHPIEVISGREEARLIYLGVSHAHADDARRKLVVDIGGGSTECILGEGAEPIEADSLQMGCVGYTREFFEDGKITREALRRAQIAAGLELASIARRYKRLGWETCIGSSGTIVACEEMLRVSGWSTGGVTAKALRKMRKALLEAGHFERLQLPALQPDRAPVLAGGVAILSAVFKSLEIERMQASPGAMREGVLHDLLGRIRHADVRDQTIRRFARRYQVDLEQAGRVERTALSMLAQVREDWELDLAACQRVLSWAARLHEIGLSIAYSGHHKHGAYITANADMPGFSRQDQQLLGTLILNHRRKPSRESFAQLAPESEELALRLCVLLRLAVRLNRSRNPRPPAPLRVQAKKQGLRLEFAPGWIEAHALSRADLDEERASLREIDFELSIA